MGHSMQTGILSDAIFCFSNRAFRWGVGEAYGGVPELREMRVRYHAGGALVLLDRGRMLGCTVGQVCQLKRHASSTAVRRGRVRLRSSRARVPLRIERPDRFGATASRRVSRFLPVLAIPTVARPHAVGMR